MNNDQSVDNDELLHLGFSYESVKEEVRNQHEKIQPYTLLVKLGLKIW
ncbi:hypothetical protein [Wolbachia pipientis]|nr:hypothetical protein [Wolbachia pipientis]MCM1001885.1 hypothetical protein [Wolbachia pipientis]